MQCSFCHSQLDHNDMKNKDTLRLCCTVNEIFCINCVFSPTILEACLFNNTVFTCQECHQIVPIEALLKKRLNINLGTYCQGKLKFGYNHLARGRTNYNPETPRRYYGGNAQLSYKYNDLDNTDRLYLQKSKHSAIFNSTPSSKTQGQTHHSTSANSANLFGTTKY